MAGHARKGNESRWITKICEPSNLTYSEFHHISSRLYYRKKAANPCLLLHENDIDHNKRKVAGVVERAALEMRWPGNWSGGSNPSLSAKIKPKEEGPQAEEKELRGVPFCIRLYEAWVYSKAGERRMQKELRLSEKSVGISINNFEDIMELWEKKGGGRVEKDGIWLNKSK